MAKLRSSSSAAATDASRKEIPGGSKEDGECHQCGRKGRGLMVVPCKLCPVKFCKRCLLTRYGARAAKVAQMKDWSCPKCRCICSCSQCMKSNCQRQTGILVHTVQASEFSSALNMLCSMGSDSSYATVSSLKSLKTKNSTASEKRSRDKENSQDEQIDMNFVEVGDNKNKQMRIQKVKLLLLKKPRAESSGVDLLKLCENNAKLSMVDPQEKESQLASSDYCNNEWQQKTNKGRTILSNDSETFDEPNPKEQKPTLGYMKSTFGSKNLDNVIPPGTILAAVAGTEMAAEDIGAALQFLEFCNAFSKVLNIKEGEAHSILRDLVKGCVGRRRACPPIVKFHMKLLSLIQDDVEDESLSELVINKYSWLLGLVKCVNEFEHKLSGSPLDCFQNGLLVYDALNIHNKLKVLNLLCNRTLDTEKMRTWIDEEDMKFIERKKMAREVILAAKKKGKELQQRLRDEMTKAINMLREVSADEHEKIFSQLKAENEKAHTEMQEFMELIPKKIPENKNKFQKTEDSEKQRRDAVRTEPLFLDGKGHVYWELGHYSGSNLLLQDIGIRDSVKLEDKWFSYNQEEEKAIETQISLSISFSA